jgi:hypothetical protein
MVEFLGERIDVEKDKTAPRPVSFRWRGRTYIVAEVLQEWVDAGFGDAPPQSRKWYNRHHRRYYVVRTTSGDVFRIYLDYADRGNPAWWLVSKADPGNASA